jgi:hypothetical protein
MSAIQFIIQSRLIMFIFFLLFNKQKKKKEKFHNIIYIYISNCLKFLPVISVSKENKYDKEKHMKMMLIITLFDVQ